MPRHGIELISRQRLLSGRRLALGARAIPIIGLLAIGLSACDDLLDVDIPGRLAAEAITDPALGDILVTSVQADFECAFSNYAAFTGLYTDEWMSSSSFGPGPEAIDKRDATILNMGAAQCSTATNPNTAGFYAPLQIARVQGETAFEIISANTVIADKDRKLAGIAAYTGYALTLLGEGFCEMALDGGSLMQPDEVLALAEERFTTALGLAQTAGATDIVNWVSVGRARVRVNRGDDAGALSDATAVPISFVKTATHAASPGRRINRHWGANTSGRFWTLDVSFRGLTVSGFDPATHTIPQTVPETRIVGTNVGVGHDGSSALWTTNKFATAAAPITIASWDEAQLIIAEIQGGQTAVNAINAIRDRAPGGALPHLVSTDPAVIRAAVLEERRRVLFGQGQRLADVVRFPTEIALPVGARPHKPSSNYNDQMTGCIPLPFAEIDGNPNF
jgi:hypothetical protein